MACAVEGDLTMGAVAVLAQLSRQAIYLHFADRAALLLALLGHLDTPPEDLAAAPSARAAAASLVAGHARAYPRLYPVARLLAGDPAWRAREDRRLADCRGLADRFRAEGALAPHLSAEAAAELLWTLTSLPVWSALVVERGWSAERYRSHVTFLAAGAVTK